MPCAIGNPMNKWTSESHSWFHCGCNYDMLLWSRWLDDHGRALCIQQLFFPCQNKHPTITALIPSNFQSQDVQDAFQPDADNDHALIFTLESIKTNAPWARRIFVLQDPQCEVVWQGKLKRGVVPEPEKILGPKQSSNILDSKGGWLGGRVRNAICQ